MSGFSILKSYDFKPTEPDLQKLMMAASQGCCPTKTISLWIFLSGLGKV